MRTFRSPTHLGCHLSVPFLARVHVPDHHLRGGPTASCHEVTCECLCALLWTWASHCLQSWLSPLNQPFEGLTASPGLPDPENGHVMDRGQADFRRGVEVLFQAH